MVHLNFGSPNSGSPKFKKEYERRKSVGTKCLEKSTQIQSKIDTIKLTSITSVSKLTALELRRQPLIPQLSSQEAVDIINKVNPPVNTKNRRFIILFDFFCLL